MVKTILYTSFVLVICISCNNHNDNQQTAASNNAKITQLQELIEKHPDSSILREDLIQDYRDNGNYDQALSQADKLIKRDSMNARFWSIKGTLNYENDDTISAVHSFENAVRLQPDPQYIITLGTLYAETKNSSALTLANQLLKDGSIMDKKQAMYIQGLYCSYSGDNIKAISFFDTCISIDYTDMYAYREKAICLYNLGKYNDAVQVLQKAVAVESNFEEGYYWMGKCYEKLNDKKDAIENYQIALQFDKNYTEASDALKTLQPN